MQFRLLVASGVVLLASLASFSITKFQYGKSIVSDPIPLTEDLGDVHKYVGLMTSMASLFIIIALSVVSYISCRRMKTIIPPYLEITVSDESDNEPLDYRNTVET